jgi:hypothetical protein
MAGAVATMLLAPQSHHTGIEMKKTSIGKITIRVPQSHHTGIEIKQDDNETH